MRTILTTAATTAGADKTIYDRKVFQNILLDASNVDHTICLIEEPEETNLSIKGNGVDETAPYRVAFVKQVNFEEQATLNETTLTTLKTCCKSFLMALVASNEFGKIDAVPVRKYQENESDFNAIGWEMTLTLPIKDGYVECES